MQLVGCDRIHKEITRSRTGATTPRERIPKRRMQATACSWWAVTAYMTQAIAKAGGHTEAISKAGGRRAHGGDKF